MATASPPRPPQRGPVPPPPGGPSQPSGPGRRGPYRTTRLLALGALALVALIAALIVFSGGGGADYRLVFDSAGQLVKGDQVQVGGVAVGSVKNIVLTPDYKARVTIHVDSSLTPLHAGTTAQIRVPSLSGVANRYVALSPGPNSGPALAAGATLPASAARGVVDIDQLFNIFNERTRRGLRNFVQGSAEQYAGASKDLRESTPYFSPSLAATNHIFAELTRDQHVFTEFLVQTAKATTTLAAHRQQLTELVSHANTSFQALGSERESLAAGVAELPRALREGNRAFAELPATLSALTKLVDVSKPNTKTLAQLFSRLRPLVVAATPVVRDLSLAVTKPGPNNDLTDVMFGYPALERSLIENTPEIIKQLGASTQFFSRFRPYAPEFVGVARSLGQSASYYDANGHYIHAGAVFNAFTETEGNNLTPSGSLQQSLQNLKLGQLRRCPGAATQPAADGSSPFTDTGQLECNPSETP